MLSARHRLSPLGPGSPDLACPYAPNATSPQRLTDCLLFHLLDGMDTSLFRACEPRLVGEGDDDWTCASPHLSLSVEASIIISWLPSGVKNVAGSFPDLIPMTGQGTLFYYLERKRQNIHRAHRSTAHSRSLFNLLVVVLVNCRFPILHQLLMGRQLRYLHHEHVSRYR